jgi:hypothetical protein
MDHCTNIEYFFKKTNWVLGTGYWAEDKCKVQSVKCNKNKNQHQSSAKCKVQSAIKIKTNT